MSLILLSQLINKNTLDVRFYDINMIKSISNADFETKEFLTYAIYVIDFKLEFSFYKQDKKMYYLSIEEFATKKEDCNSIVKFCDDINIFGKEFEDVSQKIESFKGDLKIINNSKIMLNNIHFIFNEKILEGIYFLPSKSDDYV